MKQRRTDKDIVQPRAMETREKLLKSALELYTEKGYHTTTVDEIAKNAGLSTGVAYRYFKNKKDLEHTLSAFERIHTEYYAFHEELEGLRHSDSDVGRLYDEFTKSAIQNVYDNLPGDIKKKKDSMENLYIAIGIMENYCHTFMHKRLSDSQLKVMRKKVIKTVEHVLLGV